MSKLVHSAFIAASITLTATALTAYASGQIYGKLGAKMKKYLTPLFTSALLVSCSDSTPSATTKTADVDVAKIVVTEDPVATVAPEVSALTLSFTPTKAFHFEWAAVPGATSYKLKEDITSGSGYEVIEVTTATSFDHIVPLYARLNARYVLESCIVAECTTSVPVFTSTRVAEMVDSIGYFKASNTDSNDAFGTSVSISEDGTTLAVGAPYEDSSSKVINTGEDDNLTRNLGAVYVFTRNNNTSAVWSQQAYLKASNADKDDWFGQSVSISADGNTLAVSAPLEDSNSKVINVGQDNNLAKSAGAVYVFTRNNNPIAVWSQEAYLKASNSGGGGLLFIWGSLWQQCELKC